MRKAVIKAFEKILVHDIIGSIHFLSKFPMHLYQGVYAFDQPMTNDFTHKLLKKKMPTDLHFLFYGRQVSDLVTHE